MMIISNTKLSIWLLATALCASILSIDAQNLPSCASNLVPCLPYLNSTTKPPPQCCIPLKLAIENQFECLCNLFNSPDLPTSNVAETLTLPARCGINKDLSACGTSPSPSPKSSISPPGVPPGTEDKKNMAGKIASATGFLGAVLFWFLINLY